MYFTFITNKRIIDILIRNESQIYEAFKSLFQEKINDYVVNPRIVYQPVILGTKSDQVRIHVEIPDFYVIVDSPLVSRENILNTLQTINWMECDQVYIQSLFRDNGVNVTFNLIVSDV